MNNEIQGGVRSDGTPVILMKIDENKWIINEGCFDIKELHFTAEKRTEFDNEFEAKMEFERITQTYD